MRKQPDQLIFDEIYKRAEAAGLRVYTFIPDAAALYPFIVLGDVTLRPQATKSRLIGEVLIEVDIWTNNGNRQEISQMVSDFMQLCSQIHEIDGLQWMLRHNRSMSRIMRDNTTKEMLYHANLEVVFEFI